MFGFRDFMRGFRDSRRKSFALFVEVPYEFSRGQFPGTKFAPRERLFACGFQNQAVCTLYDLSEVHLQARGDSERSFQ